ALADAAGARRARLRHGREPDGREYRPAHLRPGAGVRPARRGGRPLGDGKLLLGLLVSTSMTPRPMAVTVIDGLRGRPVRPGLIGEEDVFHPPPIVPAFLLALEEGQGVLRSRRRALRGRSIDLVEGRGEVIDTAHPVLVGTL